MSLGFVTSDEKFLLRLLEHSQKLNAYLFQNDVVLYIENEKIHLTSILGVSLSGKTEFSNGKRKKIG